MQGQAKKVLDLGQTPHLKIHLNTNYVAKETCMKPTRRRLQIPVLDVP